MKRIICLSLILIMAISLVGCGKKNKGSENVDIADSVTLLNGLSPKTKYELDELFKHTLRISPRERYKSTEELKAQLSKLISLTSDNTPYVMNMPKWQPSFFSVGRQDEIREVKNKYGK